MKKVLIAAAAMMLAAGANADIVVKFPKGAASEYPYKVVPIKSADAADSDRVDTLRIIDGKTKIADPAVPSRVSISFGRRSVVNVYAAPGENLTVDIQSIDPLAYTAKGTELMEGIIDFTNAIKPFERQFMELSRAEPRDEKAMEEVEKSYNKAVKQWMFEKRKNPAVIYALMSLEGQDFFDAFNSLTEEAKNSIIYPYAVEYSDQVKKRMEAEARMQEMQSGNFTAPNFTLKNLEGKNVSLSDFRGKWVVIDFWGSWCPWCIKGFPKLKEAYATYKGKLEVVGVDCSDPEEAWRDAVKKYELPWVNVYNPEPRGGKLIEDYAVQGFPTKVIVNPEGKIANITVGEDPLFFEKLASLINSK